MCALIDRLLLHLSSLEGGRNITSGGRNQQQMGKPKIPKDGETKTKAVQRLSWLKWDNWKSTRMKTSETKYHI